MVLPEKTGSKILQIITISHYWRHYHQERKPSLSSPSNKKQLIDLVFEFVRKMMADTKFRNSLVMAGSSDTPVEVHDGLTIQQCDCHLVSKCLVFQMKNVVFQPKNTEYSVRKPWISTKILALSIQNF